MIEQRGDHWRARLRLKGHPGISKTFTTERAAREWHDKILDSAKLGKMAEVLAEGMTFAQAVESYRAKKTVEKRGAVQEHRRLDYLLTTALAPLQLPAISKPVLRTLRDQRLAEVRGSTWNREASLILQILKHAALEHDSGIKPVDLMTGMRGQESPGRKLRIRPDLEVKLLDHAPGWVHALIVIALGTGARRGEIFALRHEHVDRGDMNLTLPGTKTEGSHRVIAMTPKVLAAIDSLSRSLTDSRIFWEVDDPQRMTEAFRRVARAAGAPEICLHVCRHEALSRMGEAGATNQILRSFSGHATDAMLSRYVKTDTSAQRRFLAA